jgi:hypothetical protein
MKGLLALLVHPVSVHRRWQCAKVTDRASIFDLFSNHDIGKELQVMLKRYNLREREPDMSVIHKINYAALFNFTIALLLGACSVNQEQPVPAGNKQQAVATVEKTSSTQSNKPDFSGVWVFNQALSDDPRELLESARKKKTGGRAGGGMGRGGGGGRSGSGTGHDKMAAHNGMKSDVAGFSAILIIEHKEPLFTLTGSDGQAHNVYTDYRSVSVSASGASNQPQMTAGWEDEVLVIETVNNDGKYNKIESYRLDADKQQLHVQSAIKLPRVAQPVTIKRVYDLKNPGM